MIRIGVVTLHSNAITVERKHQIVYSASWLPRCCRLCEPTNSLFFILGIVKMVTNDTATPVENPTARSFQIGPFVRRSLKILLVAYTLVAVLLGFFQRKLLYHPRKAKPLQVEADLALMKLYPDAKDVRLTCTDGTKIGAWLLTKAVGQKDAPRPLIIYFHGNANNRASRAPWYEIFAAIQADVLAIDYPGYGDSEGTMTEGGMYQSCDATWAYATEQLQYAPSEIILAGTSLGGAAAVYTAAQQSNSATQPAALVVTATFSSMVDVAASLYAWLPVSSILVDRYPSADRIPNVKCPIVILHGNADRLVYTKHGQALFDAAPAESESGQPKRWKTLDGIGHNGLVRLAGKQIQQEFQTVIDHLKQQR